jgi:hypothetical protein
MTKKLEMTNSMTIAAKALAVKASTMHAPELKGTFFVNLFSHKHRCNLVVATKIFPTLYTTNKTY